MTQQAQRKSRIPEFASREEEAQFWDTHDISEYWDEMEPVEVTFAENLTETLTLRLSPEIVGALRQAARRKGLRPSTLARMWLVERLQKTTRTTP